MVVIVMQQTSEAVMLQVLILKIFSYYVIYYLTVNSINRLQQNFPLTRFTCKIVLTNQIYVYGEIYYLKFIGAFNSINLSSKTVISKNFIWSTVIRKTLLKINYIVLNHEHENVLYVNRMMKRSIIYGLNMKWTYGIYYIQFTFINLVKGARICGNPWNFLTNYLCSFLF
uniref:Uncharacterized protein n=1 Tax=Rhizophagus irregularis (strain DAOM 181602 / DAOM 197198 / MUCL 43194) TaxID=747089 RepID=U9SSG0_RHIID